VKKLLSKILLLGSRINQSLSFSPLFAKSTKGAKVFWPGCALLNLEPDIIDKTYAALSAIIPGLGFCSFCCGKPGLYVNSKKTFQRRLVWLNREIEAAGIKEAYVACPNCKITLERYTGLKVFSIWEVLDGDLPDAFSSAAAGESWALHDPCAARFESGSQAAVRSILHQAGVEMVEFPHSKDNTRCCGNVGMLMVLNRLKGQAILEKRLAETPPGIPVASYCQGCVNAFRKKGKESRHIIELLFGKSSSYNWLNRYQNVHKKR